MNLKLILMSIITGSLAAVSCNDNSSKTEAATQKDSAVAVAIKEDSVSYTLDGKTFKGFVVYDANNKDKRPGVLVVHEWWGLDEYARSRAQTSLESSCGIRDREPGAAVALLTALCLQKRPFH